MHTRVHKKSKKTIEKNNECDIINNGANTHTSTSWIRQPVLRDAVYASMTSCCRVEVMEA